jgi:tetratricopeptide (TPR) repeat protein
MLQDYFRRQGHWHEWAFLEEIALTAAIDEGDILGRAQSHEGLARAYSWLSRYNDAEIHFSEALRLFSMLRDRSGSSRTHLNLGTLFELQGNFRSALHHAEEALRLASDQVARATALNNTGWYLAQLNHSEDALAHCAEALALHRTLGNRRGEYNTLDSLGYIYHLLGDFAKAEDFYTEALEIHLELGDRWAHATTLSHLGDTQLASGDEGLAREAWSAALEIFDALRHPAAVQVREKLFNLG